MSGAGSFEFVDDVTSDLRFVARGDTREAVFRGAAEALLAATLETESPVREEVRRSLTLSASRLDLLLVRFLNELVYLRDAENLLLRVHGLSLEDDPEPRLAAELRGEPFDPSRHHPACEVKAATLHGLRFGPADGGWEAWVTLDV